jgi:hypothetical protein
MLMFFRSTNAYGLWSYGLLMLLGYRLQASSFVDSVRLASVIGLTFPNIAACITLGA